MWRAVARLASALLIALAFTACGKSAAEKYREEFPKIDSQLAALAADVEQGLRGAEDSKLAAEFEGYARRLADLRERLDALEAPEKVAKDHQELLAAMAATRMALTDISEAAKRGDPAAARDAATRLVLQGQRLDEARKRVEAEVRRL
ncbi:MAG: hypothetical protein QOK00_3468 [Thermoleophilaceae bacterium]|nr:hypothetical protein [Thermoleophilaceae bacterium]